MFVVEIGCHTSNCSNLCPATWTSTETMSKPKSLFSGGIGEGVPTFISEISPTIDPDKFEVEGPTPPPSGPETAPVSLKGLEVQGY